MGLEGYQRVAAYLARKGFQYNFTTIHKYMNAELRLWSIVRTGYKHGTAHKVYDNMLQQDVTTDKPNRKWCTDFTYLFLRNEEVHYNCTSLDLFDRSVVASIADRNITSTLAVRTL